MMQHKTQHDSETAAHGQQVMVIYTFIYHNFDGVEKVYSPQRVEAKKDLH